jgi:hypothetical protein
VLLIITDGVINDFDNTKVHTTVSCLFWACGAECMCFLAPGFIQWHCLYTTSCSTFIHLTALLTALTLLLPLGGDHRGV